MDKSSNQQPQRTEGVLTQVCLECGKEYYYDRTEPPAEQVCERCGNKVFRSFFDVTRKDDSQRRLRRNDKQRFENR